MMRKKTNNVKAHNEPALTFPTLVWCSATQAPCRSKMVGSKVYTSANSGCPCTTSTKLSKLMSNPVHDYMLSPMALGWMCIIILTIIIIYRNILCLRRGSILASMTKASSSLFILGSVWFSSMTFPFVTCIQLDTLSFCVL